MVYCLHLVMCVYILHTVFIASAGYRYDSILSAYYSNVLCILSAHYSYVYYTLCILYAHYGYVCILHCLHTVCTLRILSAHYAYCLPYVRANATFAIMSLVAFQLRSLDILLAGAVRTITAAVTFTTAGGGLPKDFSSVRLALLRVLRASSAAYGGKEGEEVGRKNTAKSEIS